MQKPVPKPQKTSGSWGFLIVGSVCLGMALVLMILSKDQPVSTEKPATEEDVQPQFQSEKISAATNIGVLSEQVRPLEQTVRVAPSGIHQPEFRGTKYIQSNLKSYTIELLSFGKEDVIRDFLNLQKDRSKFTYFRFSDQQPERYVLSYGLYKSELLAEQALARLPLQLPDSIKPKVQSLKSYAPHVNDLGAEELAANTIYEVKLKRTSIPVPKVSVPKPSDLNENAPQ